MIASDPPPALAAFLRGIEPRARILARAQCGPNLDASDLLAEVRDEFIAGVAHLPFAEWPRRYWSLLLVREELANPGGPLPSHPLYQLPHTRRLVLLLRLVMGLDPAGAARVLGLSETAYRALVVDAEETLAELGVGSAVLLRWQQGFQQEIRAGAVEPATIRAPRLLPPARQFSPTQWVLGTVAAALLALLVATFFWPPAGPVPSKMGFDSTTVPYRDFGVDLVVDPDFALVTAPATAPWRQGVGFLSWWASERGTPLPAPVLTPPTVARDWADLSAEDQALLEPVRGAWPVLDAETQAALLAQAKAWRGFDPTHRQALRAAYARWLALPALQRSVQRTMHAQWRTLETGEQSALTAAAAALAVLPPEQQQAARGAYAALDPLVQQEWAKGPRLGRQLPGLRPLLLHLPAVEQAALIDAIKGLEEPHRAALAERLSTMGAAERTALRGRVLAVPATERAALLVAAIDSP